MSAKKVFDKLSGAAKAQHQAAWARVDRYVRELPKPKGTKIFEVHHTLEYARELYLAELAKGLPADLCERAVMTAYTTEESCASK